MASIVVSNNNSESTNSTPAVVLTSQQQLAENQRKWNRIIGITLLAIAAILLIGAMVASMGAAAGALPAGLAVANAFFGATPAVLIAALYMLKEGGGAPMLNGNGGISLGLGGGR